MKVKRACAIKPTHYIDMHKRLYGAMPDGIHLFVRNKAAVPITMNDEILRILEETNWRERAIPDPTLLPRKIRTNRK